MNSRNPINRPFSEPINSLADQPLIREKSYLPELPKVAKGAGINLVGAIIRDTLGFLYVLLLAKFLTTHELGLYYLGVTIINLFAIIALAGTDTGIRRFVSIYQGTNDLNGMWGTFTTSLRVVIPLSSVLALLLLLSSESISHNIFSKPGLSGVLRILSLYLPFFAIASVCLAATQALKFMQYKVYTFDIANTLLRFVFVGVFFYFGLRLFAPILAYVTSIVLATGLSIYFLTTVFPRNRQHNKVSLKFKELLSFSLPQTFSNLIGSLVNMTDTLILGYFVVAANVGIYSVALKIIMLGSCILASFNTVFAPIIADLHHQQKQDQLQNLYKTITKWAVTISLPIFLLLIFFSHQILRIFGSDFVLGSTCLVILCIGQIFNTATGPSGLMILMSGRPFITLCTNLLVLTLNVILNLLLIPKYGILGAAVATSGSMACVNIIRLIAVYYLMRIHPYKLSYLKSICASILCILMLGTVSKHIIIGSGFWPLIAVSTAFLAIYSLLLILLRLDDDDRFVLNEVRQRFVKMR